VVVFLLPINYHESTVNIPVVLISPVYWNKPQISLVIKNLANVKLCGFVDFVNKIKLVN
jgi:hypothetical protein